MRICKILSIFARFFVHAKENIHTTRIGNLAFRHDGCFVRQRRDAGWFRRRNQRRKPLDRRPFSSQSGVLNLSSVKGGAQASLFCAKIKKLLTIFILQRKTPFFENDPLRPLKIRAKNFHFFATFLHFLEFSL